MQDVQQTFISSPLHNCTTKQHSGAKKKPTAPGDGLPQHKTHQASRSFSKLSLSVVFQFLEKWEYKT